MQLILLSNQFYQQYAACPEILHKPDRPYVCLEVEIDGVTFAIPLRHHITHPHCFRTRSRAGLDYTKAVVIAGPQHIQPGTPQINQTEFNILKRSLPRIERGMRKYLSLYRSTWNRRNNPNYRNILRCSTLQYFHKELNIPEG